MTSTVESPAPEVLADVESDAGVRIDLLLSVAVLFAVIGSRIAWIVLAWW